MNKAEKNKTNFNNSILEDLKSSDKTRVNNAVKKLSNNSYNTSSNKSLTNDL